MTDVWESKIILGGSCGQDGTKQVKMRGAAFSVSEKVAEFKDTQDLATSTSAFN